MTTPVRLLGSGEVRALATELGLRPSKQRGQNFVTDGNTIRRIVAAAGLTDADVVLEVGPGLGSLTLGLLDVARSVVAVEIDPLLARRLAATVADRVPDASDRLTVIEADALRIDDVAGEPTAMVANLPYNVAVPVLLHLLATVPSLRSVLVLVQLEVAERLAAGPGSKVYGIPSVKARWYGTATLAGRIGRNVFWPAPNVDSGLVRLVRSDPPGDDALRLDTFAVVDAAFGQRRKTLRSSLSRLTGSTGAAEAALVAAGVDPGLRGEVLELEQFVAIARTWAAQR
ncbi:MAG TPA: 16S rRNA (adenine(1518)-N(6)/adenine(1519)-N(6))-dimethyltransferase RsmA [Actinopolymorphaceae bacterium]